MSAILDGLVLYANNFFDWCVCKRDFGIKGEECKLQCIWSRESYWEESQMIFGERVAAIWYVLITDKYAWYIETIAKSYANSLILHFSLVDIPATCFPAKSAKI